MIELISTLAQESGPPAPKGPDPTSALLFPAIMIAMIVFMLLTSRSQKKREQRERSAMLGRMGKNDRVLTIGGIIGTVIQVKDNDEVVLKVDESTNTKMTFLKSAIQRVITEDANDGGMKK